MQIAHPIRGVVVKDTSYFLAGGGVSFLLQWTL
ncbi:hypothetical protein [Latilactobacillus phage TMW 1.1393 P1]|nr:hypothetical protein [Latilactobacillus phage TMW 1.1393 P1]